MTFNKILVAVDQSPQASAVLAQAFNLAQPQTTILRIFHGLPTNSPGQSGPFLGIGTLADVGLYSNLQRLRQEHEHEEVEQLEHWLQPYQQQADELGISLEVDCRRSEPGAWICKSARQWNADLIVLGRRGREGLAEVLLGSVSSHVVHHAPCSVLVVQGQIAE